MSVKPKVRMEHLAKIHKDLETRGYFGSLLIQYQNGSITGVAMKEDFNPEAFIDRCEQSTKRVIVRKSEHKEAPSELEKPGNDQKSEPTVQKDAQSRDTEPGKSIEEKEEEKNGPANK